MHVKAQHRNFFLCNNYHEIDNRGRSWDNFKINKSGGYGLNKREWLRRTSILYTTIDQYISIEAVNKEYIERKLFYNEYN